MKTFVILKKPCAKRKTFLCHDGYQIFKFFEERFRADK